MKMTLTLQGKDYAVVLDRPADISVPVRFDGEGAAAFGAASARREIYGAGDFKGSVAAGGGCNCEIYTFSPHLHGTHTEGIGHIARERIAVRDMLKESLIPATVITVVPETAAESYDPPLNPDDRTITCAALERALKGAHPGFLKGLVVRTRAKEPPPFFSHEAMRYVAGLGVDHLLVDTPSVDRCDDDGKLSNHRIFWGVAAGVTDVQPSPKTITELITVPDSVADGYYLLNLQVAAFDADASPSRPVLYEVTPL